MISFQGEVNDNELITEAKKNSNQICCLDVMYIVGTCADISINAKILGEKKITIAGVEVTFKESWDAGDGFKTFVYDSSDGQQTQLTYGIGSENNDIMYGKAMLKGKMYFVETCFDGLVWKKINGTSPGFPTMDYAYYYH